MTGEPDAIVRSLRLSCGRSQWEPEGVVKMCETFFQSLEEALVAVPSILKGAARAAATARTSAIPWQCQTCPPLLTEHAMCNAIALLIFTSS